MPTFWSESETVTVSPRSTAPFVLTFSDAINAPAATMLGDGATTVNVCDALLFAEIESEDAVATFAVFVFAPVLTATAVMVKLVLAPEAISGSPMRSVPELSVTLAVLETKVSPAGRTLVTTAFKAVFGPELVMLSVKTTLLVAETMFVLMVCAIAISAAGNVTRATTVPLLFARFGSVSVVTALAVLITTPFGPLFVNALRPGDATTHTVANDPALIVPRFAVTVSP